MFVKPYCSIETLIKNNENEYYRTILTANKKYKVIKKEDGLYIINDLNEEIFVGENIHDNYFESFDFKVIKSY